MEVREEKRDTVMILTLDGRIVGASEAGAVMDKLHELLERGEINVVIDLSQVMAMNSSGLGALISGLNTMRQAGGNLKLACMNEKVLRLLTITKLQGIFESFTTVSAAVESFHRFA